MQTVGVFGSGKLDMSVDRISDTSKYTSGNCFGGSVVSALNGFVGSQSCGVVADYAFQRVTVVFVVLLSA